MKLIIKNYNSNKIKKTFQKEKIYFFFHVENIKLRNWIKIERKLVEENFKIYRIKNNLLKKKKIINALPVIYSTVLVGYIDNPHILFSNYLTTIFKFYNDLVFLSIIYNNKIYFSKEIKNVCTNSIYSQLLSLLLDPSKRTSFIGKLVLD